MDAIEAKFNEKKSKSAESEITSRKFCRQNENYADWGDVGVT
jgi:hypothetical protein